MYRALYYGKIETQTYYIYIYTSSHGASFHLAYRTKAQIKDVTSA